MINYLRGLLPDKPKSQKEHEEDLRNIGIRACRLRSTGSIRLQRGKCLTADDIKNMKQELLSHK